MRQVFLVYYFIFTENKDNGKILGGAWNISSADKRLEYEKKKIYKKVLMGIILAGLVVIGVGCYGIYWAFYDMDRLPKGELLTEDISPGGNYSLRAYVGN
ncbi:hypothetical protein JOC33_002809 [Thalassobacillus pellis]|nr:hypothetical protein [Thalassobacillus pellis]